MKRLKIPLIGSVVLCLIAIGILALLKAKGFIPKLSALDILFAPVITVLEAWLIFWIVTLLNRKKRQKD